jgi:RRXRR protein/HNH endonuclease
MCSKLPPSLGSKADSTVKAVRFVASFLPVSEVKVEIGSFDTQQMHHPEISGISYQQGTLFGYAVREYLLEKWQRTCVYCGAKGVPLQIEHLVPKSRGGSDRASNLTLACEIDKVVKPLEIIYQIRCLARGQYQRFNGKHSEHKAWAPCKVRGWKLYEIVEAKGQVGYIAGRREKGAFVIKDLSRRKKLLEVTPGRLVRVARPAQGWMITRRSALDII